MNMLDMLIVFNCLLLSIIIYFNFLKFLIYLKIIFFMIRGVEIYNLFNIYLEIIVSGEDFKCIMKMFMIFKMVLFDNVILLFNLSYNGEVLYSCDRFCDERYCR